MVAVRSRTYAEMQKAYDACKVNAFFGWDYVNLFDVDIMKRRPGDDRYGKCQTQGCNQMAPIELLGKRKGYVSGFAFTRNARTCAFHFWASVDYVLWIHHVDVMTR